jgi:hypothetical protein
MRQLPTAFGDRAFSLCSFTLNMTIDGDGKSEVGNNKKPTTIGTAAIGFSNAMKGEVHVPS